MLSILQTKLSRHCGDACQDIIILCSGNCLEFYSVTFLCQFNLPREWEKKKADVLDKNSSLVKRDYHTFGLDDDDKITVTGKMTMVITITTINNNNNMLSLPLLSLK